MRSRYFNVLLGAAAMVAVAQSVSLAANDGGSVEIVHFATATAQPNPLRLRGYLRRPNGDGPFPAIVLLHGCGGDAVGLDRNWALAFSHGATLD